MKSKNSEIWVSSIEGSQDPFVRELLKLPPLPTTTRATKSSSSVSSTSSAVGGKGVGNSGYNVGWDGVSGWADGAYGGWPQARFGQW